jgi:hypothetical protein
MRPAYACVVGLSLLGCGSSAKHEPQPDASVSIDGPACVAGGACTTNPGAGCKAGVIACQGGAPTCVDGADAADGTTCASGVCTRGECIAPATASGAIDVSTMAITAGRTCAESPAYSITALTSTTATLSATPDAGCLTAGDEVLLINLQGAPGATANVGNWELLEVASASGTGVTFAASKTRSFGNAAGSDAGIGVGATDQKVALVRVAQFGALDVAAGATITTAPWNGLVGGVIAIRAASAQVDGTISAAGGGYREGLWSQDDASCTENVATEPGESIAGALGTGSTTPNFGGPGGIAAASGISFIASAPLSSGASHATAGTMGGDANGRTVGAPGATYGAGDASKLTLGSGASGNLTCSNAASSPHLFLVDEKLAGGIVLVLAKQLTVGASGAISASANASSRDVTASGGYVFLEGGTLALGTNQVTARGGTTTGQGVNSNMTVTGGDGYIVVQGTTVTGTTSPAAHQL